MPVTTWVEKVRLQHTPINCIECYEKNEHFLSRVFADQFYIL
jgi:hypothetical protein